MSCGPSGRYHLTATKRTQAHAAAWEKARGNRLSSCKTVFKACSMHGKSCILAVAMILLIISKRLKLNDLVSSASCHCYPEIQCYKISDSRRAGGQKQLVSLCLELIGGCRVVSQVISFHENPHSQNRVREGRQNQVYSLAICFIGCLCSRFSQLSHCLRNSMVYCSNWTLTLQLCAVVSAPVLPTQVWHSSPPAGRQISLTATFVQHLEKERQGKVWDCTKKGVKTGIKQHWQCSTSQAKEPCPLGSPLRGTYNSAGKKVKIPTTHCKPPVKGKERRVSAILSHSSVEKHFKPSLLQCNGLIWRKQREQNAVG